MSSADFIKACLDAALPPGPIWEYKPGGDFEKLLDGISENIASVQDYISQLKYIRDPLLTPVLDDLEYEFGVLKDESLSESERRDQLLAIKGSRRSIGTAQFLQDTLRVAGFDVFVHRNDPPVNPISFNRMALDDGKYALDSKGAALDGGNQPYGHLLVNGKASDIEYSLCPSECEGFWAAAFFVGGPAERDPGTGYLQKIDVATVPAARKSVFERLIVSIKPLHTWVNLYVQYI
jgi:hypothetical protein